MSKFETLALSCWALLAPIHTVIAAMFVLVFFDAITGIWASLKRSEKFSSARLRNTVSKLTIYMVAIVCGFTAETYMNLDAVPIVKLIAGAIALTEMSSLVENLNSISGKNIFQGLIQKLGSPNLQKNQDCEKD